VGSQRLTAWAMARPSETVYHSSPAGTLLPEFGLQAVRIQAYLDSHSCPLFHWHMLYMCVCVTVNENKLLIMNNNR
jgi:hypothetical protein